jgi:RNA polymerase sigma-70 factor (ECF subfamily)
VASFEEVVTSYQSRLFCLCFRLLGDAAEAEDAVQETFLRAYQYRRRYDPGWSLATWLLSIASHYCIDCLRRRHLTWVGLDDDGLADHPALHDPAIGPESAALQAESRRELLAQILKLTPRDQAVIVLRYWGYLSYVEIAAATGSTVSAVKSRLHLARLRLRTLLRKQAARVPTEPGSERLYTIQADCI